MLSLTCKTAIKAVIFLCSKFDSGQNSGIREIATAIQASEHTVGKLLQTLVKNGVINSIKGPSGGFNISEGQRKLPIIAIVEAIDGKLVFKECGLGLAQCSAAHPCPIHFEYQESRDMAERIFRTKKVIDLCDPVNSGIAYLSV
jgi:Rrf2 family protein